MPVTFSICSHGLAALVDRLKAEEIKIPPHQRDFVWLLPRQRMLVTTIQGGLPMPEVLIRQHASGIFTLEDGQQRLSTLRRYFDDEITDESGRKFSALTPLEQAKMMMYQVSVKTYAGATDIEAIRIFMIHQFGVPLSVGERIHAMAALSPLVRVIRLKLLDGGFHARATAIWGARHLKSGPRCGDLVKMYALCAGLIFGPAAISRKWDDIEMHLEKDMSAPVADGSLVRRSVQLETMLDRLFTILEEVQAAETWTTTKLKKQLDPGFVTGYIAYSLYTYPDDFERLKAGWVTYLTAARVDPDIHEADGGIYRDKAKTRSWNTERWEMGYLNVFNPDEAARRRAGLTGTEDDEEEDE
jgi:hypothetical protein